MGICDLLGRYSWLKWLAHALACKEPTPPQPPNPKWECTNGTVTIMADTWSASTVRSLNVRGVEYLAWRNDRGAWLQTALSWGSTPEHGGEGINPTEGGSVPDGDGPTSSSKIISASVNGTVYSATSQLCYWYPYNGQTLSDIVLDKRVELSYGGLWNVIKDSRTCHNPVDREQATFEFLTGYLTPAFSAVYKCDPAGNLTALPYTPSATFDPNALANVYLPDCMILATPDGSSAMGIKPETGGPGTGAWMGAGNYSNKWSTGGSITPFKAGPYTWTVYVAVGTLEEVRKSLIALAAIV